MFSLNCIMHFMREAALRWLQDLYGFRLIGTWTEAAFNVFEQASTNLCEAFDWCLPVQQPWMRGVQVRLEQMAYNGLTSRGLVRLNPVDLTTWTVVHELGHAWDASRFWTLSLSLMLATHSYNPAPLRHHHHPLEKSYWYHVGCPPPPCGVDQNFNRFEDFAEAVAAHVYPDEAHTRATQRGYPYEKYGYSAYSQTPRGKFIAALVGGQKKAPTA